MNKLLSTKEIAQVLGISRRTLFAWKSLGMPYSQAGPNRRLMFDEAEVRAWLNRSKGDK